MILSENSAERTVYTRINIYSTKELIYKFILMPSGKLVNFTVMVYCRCSYGVSLPLPTSEMLSSRN